jgi:carbonic anhydrase
MWVSFIFLACTLLYVNTAFSNEPEHHAASPAVVPAPVVESSKGIIKELPKPPKHVMTEEEFAVKIKERLAALRKAQAAKPAPVVAHRKAHKKESVHEVMPTSSQYRTSHAIEMPAHHVAHWAYEGENGPIRWGMMNPAWAKCDTGTRQSPIDIRDGIKVDLEAVGFDYKPSRFNVLDNGHTIQVSLGGGNHITVMGRMYELVQFHFHRPSEERVNGRGFAMVAHLVHKDADGKLAVVAVLIEEGKPHSLVQTVWNNLPLEKNEPVMPTTMMDMNQLLPEHRDYYTYMGSLTTPPCSEGVLWIVLKEPIQISAQQLAIFTKLYPLNARPIQMGSGRLIKESN